jgi:hypothetical protein
MKCLIIDTVARTIQAMLNQMIVGRVFTVEVRIRAAEETRAKI